MPTYDELGTVCELIHTHFVRSRRMMYGVSSGRQLTFLLNRFIRERSVRAVIDQELGRMEDDRADEPDRVVEAVLEFLRHWAIYSFPKYLRVVDRIQRHVLSRAGLEVGDYSVLATGVENFFLDAAVFALDEYGIPVEVARKLEPALSPKGDLDRALTNLRLLDLSAMNLSPFERQLVRLAMAEI